MKANRSRIIRRTVAVAAVLALGAGGAVAWKQSSHARAEATTPSAPAVTTQEAAVRTLEESRNSSCTLDYGPSATLTSAGQGTITAMPTEGATITPGHALYSVDGVPVVLLRGTIPAWRELSASTSAGPDIAQLKHALADLGIYTINTGERLDTWNKRLTQAVRAFQESVGMAKTGALPLGSVVFQPSDIRVASLVAALGQRISDSAEVFTWTSTNRQLTCPLAASDRRFVRIGSEVSASFLDGTEARGTIAAMSPAKGDDKGADSAPKVLVQVPLAPGQAEGELDGSSAQVIFRSELAKDTLAVPVTALVALTSGGFAVQVQRPSGELEYVPVKPGVFADTWVQITDTTVRAGDKVVVTP